ncbi:cysteine hydrolase family protein [Mesorhizobium australicum]|uniref:Nicotinamidase-related amidase n=1 Tax=Mesorhizobium australicum TaxID=536018 RepID=A0A1X7MYA5_9HYPH|nr:cysteine hydrolase [Mesorhizobium australicum]SMH29883.1 Nicotinamidase-related amidase [Mesorhizobium australicum]
MASKGLIHGPLGENCLHLCVDMQAVFLPGSPWSNPWMGRVLPAIEEIAGRHVNQTVFTRFIPAPRAEVAPGMWKRYYRKWESLTLDRVDPHAIELVPSLARFVPPATILDKLVYSPWTEGRLDAMLKRGSTHTLVVTGGETDVCVLATVLGAIDRGFRTVIVADAICGSADETHDAAMTLYSSRFSEQVEIVTTEEIVAAWP